jgi:hypothetical protein
MFDVSKEHITRMSKSSQAILLLLIEIEKLLGEILKKIEASGSKKKVKKQKIGDMQKRMKETIAAQTETQ